MEMAAAAAVTPSPMALDVGSTAFMLASTGLVQLMTPGLAFFYGGLVSHSSVVTMMMQSFAALGIGSIFWYTVGFSLCFGDSLGFVGNPLTYFCMNGVNVQEPLLRDGQIVVPGIPGLLFAAYQGMFAIITPALMTGAFADRMRFKPYLLFFTGWLFLVYAPWCHWVWGGGFLQRWGVFDFAGGIVVHVTAGFGALASLAVVGKRPSEVQSTSKPHNVPFVALGTAMLWFGWFGFNGGSATAATGTAVAATVNSHISASVALTVWLFIEWFRNQRVGLVGLCTGAIAGLATVTPCAGFVQPWGAAVLGLVSTFFCYACCNLVKNLGLDDALDVWGVHGMGGFLGSLLLGLLADSPECGVPLGQAPKFCVNPGTVTRSADQVWKQCVAVVACAAYSSLVTLALLKVINLMIPVRPCEESVRRKSLDELEHGEQAYAADVSPKAAAMLEEEDCEDWLSSGEECEDTHSRTNHKYGA